MKLLWDYIKSQSVILFGYLLVCIVFISIFVFAKIEIEYVFLGVEILGFVLFIYLIVYWFNYQKISNVKDDNERLLDENGQTIKEWTTTSNAYVISDLKVGKYTLEEISAPNGYSLNTNKQIIEVKNNGETLNIEFQNAKTVIVPNTNVNSKIITIIGTLLLIISLGTGLAYKNAKSK